MSDIHKYFKTFHLNRQFYAYTILCLVVMLTCLMGILSRPANLLAFFWPANAVLLGMFLRLPQLNNTGGWLGAFSGYILADLITGNSLVLTLFLTVSNIITVSVSLFFIYQTRLNYRNYNKGFTFLYLFSICALAGCFASALFAVNTIPYAPNTFMSPDRKWIDFGMWWTGEIINCITILPLILAFPARAEFHHFFTKDLPKISFVHLLPLFAIIISVIFTHIFFGPGALLYPLAAMIWAALTYRLFSLTIVNSIVCLVTYHSLTSFYLSESSDAYFSTAISVRIGLCMLGLAPLVLAIISSNRQELYQRVLYMANHDSLTKAMNRHSFFEKGERLIKNSKSQPLTAIMMDIDHFKKMNDQYGHHTGDLVLQNFADQVRTCLRSEDLFARIGGEEFIILLSCTEEYQAHQIAERIRQVIESTPVHQQGKSDIYITVSIGVAKQNPDDPVLQHLVNTADQALYQAKSQGRNQVMIASFH